MNDIQNQEDLFILVSSFYDKLLEDKSINYIFTDVVKINLSEHLPELVTFWAQALLGKSGYNKNVMQMHLDIHHKIVLTEAHFTTWLKHFNASVDENFKGIIAEKAKTQALSIATVMQIKMKNL